MSKHLRMFRQHSWPWQGKVGSSITGSRILQAAVASLQALREKYSTKRRDVGPPEDGDEGADDDDPASGGSSPGGGFGGGPSSSDSGPTGLDIDGPGGGLTIV